MGSGVITFGSQTELHFCKTAVHSGETPPDPFSGYRITSEAGASVAGLVTAGF
jgi:hypothetical protein